MDRISKMCLKMTSYMRKLKVNGKNVIRSTTFGLVLYKTRAGLRSQMVWKKANWASQ